MEVAEFLALFANWADEELHKLREVTELPPCPDDASSYFALAAAALNGDCSDEARANRRRLLAIFRELAYFDGRSAPALLLVAEMANFVPDEYELLGINALADLHCYLQNGGSLGIPRAALLEIFGRLAEHPRLDHNAANCLRFVELRMDQD